MSPRVFEVLLVLLILSIVPAALGAQEEPARWRRFKAACDNSSLYRGRAPCNESVHVGQALAGAWALERLSPLELDDARDVVFLLQLAKELVDVKRFGLSADHARGIASDLAANLLGRWAAPKLLDLFGSSAVRKHSTQTPGGPY